MTKDITGSSPSTMKIMVVAPPDGNSSQNCTSSVTVWSSCEMPVSAAVCTVRLGLFHVPLTPAVACLAEGFTCIIRLATGTGHRSMWRCEQRGEGVLLLRLLPRGACTSLTYGRRPGQPSSSSLARRVCVQSPTSSSILSSSTSSRISRSMQRPLAPFEGQRGDGGTSWLSGSVLPENLLCSLTASLCPLSFNNLPGGQRLCWPELLSASFVRCGTPYVVVREWLESDLLRRMWSLQVASVFCLRPCKLQALCRLRCCSRQFSPSRHLLVGIFAPAFKDGQWCERGFPPGILPSARFCLRAMMLLLYWSLCTCALTRDGARIRRIVQILREDCHAVSWELFLCCPTLHLRMARYR